METICDNFETVSVKIFKGSSMVETTNDTALSDRKRIVAHFTNLSENENFLATASVYYTQQVTQLSNHVAISKCQNLHQHYFYDYAGTFDIWKVDYTISFEAIYLTVDYVNGSKIPHQFYAELQCASKTLAELLNGSFGLISNVPPNEMCTLRVTDGDAAENIGTIAAITVEGITVPGATVYNSIVTTSVLSTATSLPSTTPTSRLQ